MPWLDVAETAEGQHPGLSDWEWQAKRRDVRWKMMVLGAFLHYLLLKFLNFAEKFCIEVHSASMCLVFLDHLFNESQGHNCFLRLALNNISWYKLVGFYMLYLPTTFEEGRSERKERIASETAAAESGFTWK